MEKTLHNSGSIPNDKEFIKAVIDKAEQVLLDKYLEKNEQGEYAGIYSTSRMQYDYARDDAKITISESIGYIKLLIDNFVVPLKEKRIAGYSYGTKPRFGDEQILCSKKRAWRF
jgi:hypothetical protein